MASLPSSATALTHILTFVAGIAVGKAIDQDELNAYRSSNEGFFARIRRRIKGFAAGFVVLGLIYSVGRKALTGGGGKDDKLNK
jgi:hypothetical protein